MRAVAEVWADNNAAVPPFVISIGCKKKNAASPIQDIVRAGTYIHGSSEAKAGYAKLQDAASMSIVAAFPKESIRCLQQ